ncbi:Vacuolar amino acid transporter 6 [Diplonema papillatum]|nr:Vacuolar amino acid transporter 6 [Diplonema papillatum]
MLAKQADGESSPDEAARLLADAPSRRTPDKPQGKLSAEQAEEEALRYWWMGRGGDAADDGSDAGPNEPEGLDFGIGDSPPSGVGGATANLLNCILDAGIVGVPYVLGQSGLVLGSFLVVLTGVASCYSLELLISIGDTATRNNAIAVVAYEEVAELAGGMVFRALLLASQFLFCFGALVGYVIVIKDNLADAIHGLANGTATGHDDILFTTGVSVALLLPLCCLRAVSDLGHVSAVTVGVVVAIVAIFSYELAVVGFQGTHGKDSYAEPEFVDTLGICVFAFLCHHNQFSIYRSLGSSATPARFSTVIRGAVAFAVLMSLAIGVVVFETFGRDIKGDIFENYESRTRIDVARLLMSVNMMLSFPMNFGVARETLQVLLAQMSTDPEERERHAAQRNSIAGLAPGDRRSNASGAYAGCRLSTVTAGSKLSDRSCMSFDQYGRPTAAVYSELDHPPLTEAVSAARGGTREHTSLTLHLTTTLPLFALTIGVGLVAPDLGPTLDLVGGLLGSLLGFVFPAYFALQLETNPLRGRLACWTMLVLGSTLALVSTVTSVRDIVLGDGDTET